MALRSLIVKLKALPLRMPGSGAFAPKDCFPSPSPTSELQENAWSTGRYARLTDPAKYDSLEEMAKAIGPLLKQQMKLDRAEHQKRMRAYNRNTVLIGVVGFGSCGYLASHV